MLFAFFCTFYILVEIGKNGGYVQKIINNIEVKMLNVCKIFVDEKLLRNRQCNAMIVKEVGVLYNTEQL